MSSISFFFFFNDTATTEIYTLFPTRRSSDLLHVIDLDGAFGAVRQTALVAAVVAAVAPVPVEVGGDRSEEHTSELQSQSNLVCRLLLEKKKKNKNNKETDHDALEIPTLRKAC